MQTEIRTRRPYAASVSTGLVLAALWATPAGYTQQGASSAKSLPAAHSTGANPSAPREADAKRREAREESAKPEKPAGEGIQVHGHWVIDVRNPDGKLVEHRDFENSLVTVGNLPSGDQLLAGLLSGNLTAGDPGIGLVQGTPGTDPSTYCNTSLPAQFGNNLAPNTTCFGLTTAASGMTSFLANFTTGLTSTVSFSPAVKWVLSGNYTAPATLSSISAVQTLVATCFPGHTLPFVKISSVEPTGGFDETSSLQFAGTTSIDRVADFAPAACVEQYAPSSFSGAIGGNQLNIDYLVFTTFTSTKLATPLALSAGQIVTVTVTISFS